MEQCDVTVTDDDEQCCIAAAAVAAPHHPTTLQPRHNHLLSPSGCDSYSSHPLMDRDNVIFSIRTFVPYDERRCEVAAVNGTNLTAKPSRPIRFGVAVIV